MTIDDEDGDLTRIADHLADGTPIDWDGESTARPDIKQLLDELRIVESVAVEHRGPPEMVGTRGARAGEAEPAVGSPSSSWGSLRILERIGRGSFANVYRAHDPLLDHDVALKLLRPDRPLGAQASELFLEEARNLARVRHPNVVTVYGADRREGRVGMWTELIHGRTLEDVLAADGPLGAREAAGIGLDLCRALAAIHGRGLVHGDVKASNVMREQGGRIVLMDFGSVRDASSSRDALSFGTPASMAPEQMHGASDARADVYGLGVLLYQLLAGLHPRQLVPRPRTMGERVEFKPLRELRPDVPVELVRIVEQAMAHDAERRFPSVAAMEQALAAASHTPSLPDARRRLPRAWIRPAFAGAAAAAVVATLAMWNAGRSPERSRSTRPVPERAAQPVPVDSAAGSVGISSETPASAATKSPGAIANPVRPLAATVRLYRERRASLTELVTGDPVSPGDELFLDIESADRTHVYVLNEDDRGEVFVLFPIRGIEPTNPLPPGVRHRLPGRLGGEAVHWQVTSSGGHELVVVIASRQPLTDLERDVEGFQEARAGAPVVYGTLSPSATATLRGIAGLVEGSSTPAEGTRRLAGIVPGPGQGGPDLWIWRAELTNRP